MNSWFATPYYQVLYAHRDEAEAAAFVRRILDHVNLPSPAYGLDAGCGEGRYARALAKAGLIVDAIDNAVQYPDLPEGVRFFFEDLNCWQPDRTYHLIGSFFASLGTSIQRWEDFLRLVQRLASWLQPGGWLIIDYLNIYCCNSKAEETLQRAGYTFHIRRWQDAHFLYKQIEIEGETYLESLFKLTQGDFYQALARSGLNVQATWGDYTATPFLPEESPRLILLAQKPLY
ncbi:MAG: methyltransferase domain-containing protein [Bacteroidia bacterium]